MAAAAAAILIAFASAGGRCSAGERVVFLGDSITHGGEWEYYLQLLENLRHPGSGVRMVNAGVSGGTAEGGLRRFETDVLARRPDRIVAMFGMNDLFGGLDRIPSYTNNLRKIVDAAAAAKVPLTLVTPTPYDDWGTSETEAGGASERRNGVLTAGAAACRALAQAKGVPLIELHRPLTEAVRTHPADGLIRPDRVHPTPRGHVVMATRVWAETEGTGPFSDVTFAASGRSFSGTYAPAAMPLPNAEPFSSVAAILPCVTNVNREILRVKGLDAGRYSVALDGREIATATAEELSAGLDVAWLDTPNQRRSRAALKTLGELMDVTRRERGIVALEELAVQRGADAKIFASVTNALIPWIAAEKARKNPWIGYWDRQLSDYLVNKPRQADDAAAGEALYRRLADECRPVASKLTVAEVVAPAGGLSVRRVFREARVTRGNTNIMKVQPIDDAAWVWMPGDGGTDTAFLKFRNEFEVKEGDGPLTIDVSADERYHLTCDGAFVSRGPNRSTVENWQYNTYEIDLKPGKHVLEATVWKTCDFAPLAQLSWRGGFILKANEAYDQRLTTGVAKWKVGRLSGIEPAGADNGVWGTGSQWQITGSGIVAAEPKSWSAAEVVRGFAGTKGPRIFGGRTNGWMLFPSQIPDQTETVVRPGKIVATTLDAPWRGKHVYLESETKIPVPKVIPANTHVVQAAWDLGRYICAYPVLKMKGAKGARVAWDWTEASKRSTDDLKGGEPGARDAIVGRYLEGYGDTFVCDGKGEGTFTTPWFRCGKWCRLSIETGAEPLEITDIHLVESRYPLEMESAFVSKDDASLQDIRRICARAMQMCCHEMLFDCPYYEQQMYPGDTRVQLNVISAMTRDDRIIRRAIELYDLGTRDDGQCPFNWPTRGTQEGATYTLCYLLMYGDYAMNHADRDWLRARLPGLRKSMSGMELYENADGLLENLPGWQFVDWVVGWDDRGTAPGGLFGEGVNAEANLFWLLAMESAATTERALGNELQARHWESKAEKLKAKVVERFWCERRGLFADTPAMTDFSEHAQCLALLGDVLPADKAKTCFGHLVSDADLRRTTVYFDFYLFETYFKFGRGDLFLKRLDLWRDYVKKGLTTTQEQPDWADEGGVMHESRSDCHAWGAHPIWFMQTGLAGIRSAAPFFAKVRVAPCPGPLAELKARHPHPQGFVEVDLRFADGRASGTVKTPVAGTFEFGGRTVPLVAGENAIE